MQASRVLSLDVFRGLTVCVMIIVNTMGPGAQPYPLLVHADWIGFTIADLVFPSFLFVMGNALAFVALKPMSDRDFFVKAAKRAIILFLLGFLLYWYPFVHLTKDLSFAPNLLSDTRIMGVLQRIAICYALAALCARFLRPWHIAALSAVILLGYWGLLVWGAPPGLAFDKAHNLGSLIDNLILGPKHVWRWDGGFEPEGLLGCLPATVNVLAGYLAARLLIDAKSSVRKVLWLLLCGTVLIGAALLWAELFPISKKLWTSSFVLLTIGLDLVLLALLTGILGVRQTAPGTVFFDVFGRNPLAIYLFSELLPPTLTLFKAWLKIDPYAWLGIFLFQPIAPGPLGSLLCAIFFMLICWSFGYALYRKRIFIRL